MREFNRIYAPTSLASLCRSKSAEKKTEAREKVSAMLVVKSDAG